MIGAAVASVVLGATVIEKHFTISRADGGVDSAFSLEPNELKSLVDETRRAFAAIGKPIVGIQAPEVKSLKFKRSLYAVEDIREGQAFNNQNI